MSDFIKSDYCQECGGQGFIWTTQHVDEGEQCEECERLHRLELRTDRLHDEAKGN